MFWTYLEDPEYTITLLGIVFLSCISVPRALTLPSANLPCGDCEEPLTAED
jgi:hypothetical protein